MEGQGTCEDKPLRLVIGKIYRLLHRIVNRIVCRCGALVLLGMSLPSLLPVRLPHARHLAVDVVILPVFSYHVL